MSSEDYLLRQLRQLGTLIAKLIGLREKKKHHLAIEEIDQILSAWFDVEIGQLQQFTADETIRKISEGRDHSFDELNALAELIYQRVITMNEINAGQKNEINSLANLSKALFEYIEIESGNFSFGQQQKISMLDKIASGA